MAYVAIADQHAHLHDPQTFVTKYIWSQDHKVIAIQYAITAMAIGLVALGLSVMMRMQLGFPDTLASSAREYYQFVTMHGMIMVIYLLTALFLGGFGNLLIPLQCGARHGLPVHEHALVLGVPAGRARAGRELFVPGGPTGAGWTLYPPQAISHGTAGSHWGITLMLVSLAIFIVAFTMGGLNYVVTVLQARCRGMTMMDAALGLGHLHGDDPGPARLPSAARERGDDDARPAGRHQLLHAGDRVDG